MRKVTIVAFFIVCFAYPGFSFAQQLLFTPRDNVIFATLSQLQEKEEAIGNSLRQARTKLVKERIAEKKSKSTILSNIASRTHAYLNTESTYNGNVDSLVTKKKSSVIHKATPGVKVNLAQQNRFFTLDASVNNNYYSNRDRSNSQDAQMAFLSNFTLGRYILSFSNDYFNNYIAQPCFNIKKESVVHYWRDALRLEAGSHFNRYDFNVGLSRTFSRYEPDARVASDSNEDSFTLYQHLSLTPKVHLSFEYLRSRTKPTYEETQENKSNSNTYTLALREVLSYKVSNMISISYAETYVKTGSYTRGISLNEALDYRMSERSNLSLSFGHAINDEKVHSNYSIANSLTIDMRHRLGFNPKLAAILSYSVSYSDRLKKEPVVYANVRTYSFGLTYAYKKWLDLALDYQYIDNYYNYAPKYETTMIVFKSQARF
jgi:hypothetical protein